MVELSQAEQSAVDEYENDMEGMDLIELQEEFNSISTSIDEETSWQEALFARIKQLT